MVSFVSRVETRGFYEAVPGLLASLRSKSCSWKLGFNNIKRTLQNRAFVQILHFRDFKILTYYIYAAVLKSLTPKVFGIEQNPWFCKALDNINKVRHSLSICLIVPRLDGPHSVNDWSGAHPSLSRFGFYAPHC